jgi:hypothetical protein
VKRVFIIQNPFYVNLVDHRFSSESWSLASLGLLFLLIWSGIVVLSSTSIIFIITRKDEVRLSRDLLLASRFGCFLSRISTTPLLTAL